MSRLRFAVIGAGHLGRIHTRLISENERAELVGVVDSHRTAAENAANEHSTEAFDSYDGLCDRIDAAIVAAPTVAHEQIANDLISSGVHVFVEKPITVHPAQAKRLISAASKRGVALQVGHVEQFNPAWQTASRLLKHPSFLSAHRCAPFSFRSTDISVVHDLMIHDIELVLSAVDRPVVDVKAWGQCVLTDHEDTATAWIQFDDGRMANLTASRVHHEQVRQMHVHEGNQQIVVDFAGGSVTTLDAGNALGSLSSFSPGQLRELQASGVEGVMSFDDHEVVAGNAIAQEHEDFIDSILENRQPRVSGQQGHDALVLAEQIVAEIRRHKGRVSLRPAA